MSPEKPHSDATIGVLVVEDSPFFQRALVDLYEEDPAIRVLGTAATAQDAVRQAALLKPDVISLDLELSAGDGFEVARQVMAEQPTPILVVTANPNPDGQHEAYHALRLGVVDVAEKPSTGQLSDPMWRQAMRDQLKLVARSTVLPHVLWKVRQRLRRLEQRRGGRLEQTDPGESVPAAVADLICVVGSAGSPRTVASLLRTMRSSLPLPVPIVFAMHLGPLMGVSLARFLAQDLSIDARPLVDGERLEAGPVYIAPGGKHVELEAAGRVRLFDELPGSAYRPSLSHLLGSVAEHYGERGVGVILTGMGEDGVEGMLRLRKAGGVTLAQDAESCLVASMPTAACRRGAVVYQLAPEKIANRLVRLAMRSVTLDDQDPERDPT